MIWNKELKKLAAAFLAIFFISLILGNLCVGIYGNRIRKESNEFLAALFGNVLAVYPDVSEEELIRILDGKGNEAMGETILAHYGIYEEYGNESFALPEKRIDSLQAGINLFLCLLFCGGGVLLFWYLRKRQQRISGLETYMEALNREGYRLDLESNDDDELSGLRNEIYKLTVLLKEQAALAAAQKKALADSVADISHQLKTPLTSMMVLMDNLSENIDMDRETRQHFMSEITRQLAGMSWLIATMLKLSGLDAEVVEMECRPYGLRMLVEETLQKLEIAAEWKEISFSVDIPETAKLLADRKWTVEALLNLVKNAIEHSPAGSCIEIKGEENEVYVQISVKDHGEGITEEEREKLFRRFYRGRSAKEDSVGLGLALAKKIVEKQGGYISVESESGCGTTFILKFIK